MTGVGDMTTFMTEVKTTWGRFYPEQELLMLDQDGKIWFRGVHLVQFSDDKLNVVKRRIVVKF